MGTAAPPGSQGWDVVDIGPPALRPGSRRPCPDTKGGPGWARPCSFFGLGDARPHSAAVASLPVALSMETVTLGPMEEVSATFFM